MKKLIVMGIVLAMVMGLGVAASAAVDAAWVVQLRAYNTADNQSAGTVTLGTKVGASDGYTTAGAEDGTISTPQGNPGVIISTIVPEQLTSKDYRAPLVVGETKVWDLIVYLNGVTGAGTIKLDGWVATNLNQLNESTDGDPNIVLTLMQGAEVLWTVPYNTSGTQIAPLFTTNLAYSGSPIALQLVASCMPAVDVPEPGSMVAMLSGIVGLVGFGIRRRK